MTHILYMKHLPSGKASGLCHSRHMRVNLNQLTHTEIHTELELPFVNPESFVLALRLSVKQSPLTWVSLCLCLFFPSPSVDLFPSQCHIKLT